MVSRAAKPTKAQKERWKIIPGFDGLYRVSDHGRVQSCHKYGSRDGERVEWWDRKFLTMPKGYVFVGLGKHGKRQNWFIHRLVAQAFIPNPNNLPAVNHHDGDKRNNHWANLEWCTNAQNSSHAVRTGLMRTGTQHPSSKLSHDQVVAILAAPGTYKEIAERFGISSSSVYKIMNRRCYPGIGLDIPVSPRKPRSERMRGLGNPAAKLTEKDVLDIRASNLSNTLIAEQYGVSLSTASHIRLRRSWKHL